MNFYIQSACPDNFLGFKEIILDLRKFKGNNSPFPFPKISINSLCLHWGHQKHFSERTKLFIYFLNLKYLIKIIEGKRGLELEVGVGIFQAGNKNGKIPMFAQSWVNKSIICSAGQNNFHS